MSDWDEEAAAGSIPPPPQNQGNKTYSVIVTYNNDVSEYTRVESVGVNPGMVILKQQGKEVLIPITPSIKDIEVSEEAILS